ncbi:MAG: OmpA family protein [Anaplasmataceae bacterium]|nr:OmpA family protein [Anaplasmataceae bacterium]
MSIKRKIIGNLSCLAMIICLTTTTTACFKKKQIVSADEVNMNTDNPTEVVSDNHDYNAEMITESVINTTNGGVIFFRFDRSDVQNSQSKEALTKLVQWLNDHPNENIVLIGNADERGTVDYNIGLGERRANSVAKFLTDNGIDKDRVIVKSHGKEFLRCDVSDPNLTDKDRIYLNAQSRRVVILGEEFANKTNNEDYLHFEESRCLVKIDDNNIDYAKGLFKIPSNENNNMTNDSDS